MTEIYCGCKKLPKNKRIGTAKQCKKQGQIRRYGQILVNEVAAKVIKNKATIKKEDMVKMVKMVKDLDDKNKILISEYNNITKKIDDATLKKKEIQAAVKKEVKAKVKKEVKKEVADKVPKKRGRPRKQKEVDNEDELYLPRKTQRDYDAQRVREQNAPEVEVEMTRANIKSLMKGVEEVSNVNYGAWERHRDAAEKRGDADYAAYASKQILQTTYLKQEELNKYKDMLNHIPKGSDTAILIYKNNQFLRYGTPLKSQKSILKNMA